MLDWMVWIVIIVLFILSFAGIIYPIIPSVLVIWVGFLLYQFIINPDELTIVFWIIMAVFTLFLFLADILANSYFVKKYGGSKWGERGAVVAVIVGSFIIPPFGILIVPFITVFVIELLQQRPPNDAIKASIGSLLGFLGGSIAKVLIQLIMIIWFFIVIIF
ncbi:DUF456 domain-containing protein [Oceanobacillus caeni]|uniref:DUF456 domain-containing protein n=1 Tax=Oceanobacillus caeni TaxID=405946 RepID=UPI0006228253|nr:DUF456 domain-containing protein [Oceanobacillus caeni]KKE79496.1 membrane protein [Bacilli bacterium VT-13-104]PZD83687.1 DUF456 domain-containing protein [Bacilli bacterium]MCR1835999.1 DUF456 domain-containing protein [Oceanobacillus caeni]PZD84827.1 DUF456 domain-containing protein [Bacilli bacterium]PZD87164.1 DUF456 domain-containing protein [Bacilli bacterium]